jgi:hypothetical protein
MVDEDSAVFEAYDARSLRLRPTDLVMAKNPMHNHEAIFPTTPAVITGE